MILLSFLLACDTLETQLQLKSPEEQLIDMRFEYKESIDTLYGRYGGNQLVETINTSESSEPQDNVKTEKPNNEAVNQLMATLKNTVKAQDRSLFEQHCLEIGSGESPIIATPKASAFFTDPTNIAACKEVALKQIKIRQLEIEINNPTPKPIE